MSTKKEEFKKEMEDVVIANPIFSFEENGQRIWSLDETTVNQIDEQMQKLNSYIAADTGLGKSESEKNNLYGTAVGYWQVLQDLVTNCQYNLYLNRPEYNYLRKLLIEEAEYDVDTIFFGLSILPSLEGMKEQGGNFKDDETPIVFKYNSRDITIIYHLIGKHKVKGLNNKSRTFAGVLQRLGKVSKIFEFYNNETKAIAEYMNQWIAAFTEESRQLAEMAAKAAQAAKKATTLNIPATQTVNEKLEG